MNEQSKLLKMTYQDYLNNWCSNFGDATSGDYGYWDGNKHYPYPVHKLTEQEFNSHLAALSEAETQINATMKSNDDIAVRAAFNKSLPHELELLL